MDVDWSCGLDVVWSCGLDVDWSCGLLFVENFCWSVRIFFLSFICQFFFFLFLFAFFVFCFFFFVCMSWNLESFCVGNDPSAPLSNALDTHSSFMIRKCIIEIPLKIELN